MKKLMMFMLIAFFATLISQPLLASGKDNLKGTWNYKVPYAPYEYAQGKLVFGEADGVKTITIKLTSGTELKAEKVKIENDQINFTLWVEGGFVQFAGKLAEGKISGKIDSPEGPMELTAERAKAN